MSERKTGKVHFEYQEFTVTFNLQEDGTVEVQWYDFYGRLDLTSDWIRSTAHLFFDRHFEIKVWNNNNGHETATLK